MHPLPVPSARFTFRPLERDDLPLLADWFSREHVARWWRQPGAPAALEEKYFGNADGVRRFVAGFDGVPVGMTQWYLWSDSPGEAEAVGATPGELGIDYFIGEADLVGKGIGSAMLRAFLDYITRAREARELTGVRVDVSEANVRSWRCLEGLGFRRQREGVLVAEDSEPHFVYVLEL